MPVPPMVAPAGPRGSSRRDSQLLMAAKTDSRCQRASHNQSLQRSRIDGSRRSFPHRLSGSAKAFHLHSEVPAGKAACEGIQQPGEGPVHAEGQRDTRALAVWVHDVAADSGYPPGTRLPGEGAAGFQLRHPPAGFGQARLFDDCFAANVQGSFVHSARRADALGDLGPAFHVDKQSPHLLGRGVGSGRHVMFHN
jgi:hypothetical protein